MVPMASFHGGFVFACAYSFHATSAEASAVHYTAASSSDTARQQLRESRALPAAAEACAHEYEAQLPTMLGLSSAQTQFEPRDHHPEEYWRARREAMSMSLGNDYVSKLADDGGYDDVTLRELFNAARQQLLACWINGGRYWEAELQLAAYNWSQSFNVSADDGALAAALKALPNFGRFGLPQLVRSSVCAPASCGRAAVLAAVLPRYFQVLLRSPVPLPRPRLEHVTAHELADWEGLRIDFAVMGADNCGSTSLYHNLGQHPDIDFSTENPAGDYFFGAIAHRLLPLRSHIDAFHRARARSERQLGRGRRSMRGFFNPMLHQAALARQALASIDGLRVIMVVCDPVGRAEKAFMRFYYCGTRAEDRGTRNQEQQCSDSIAAAFDMRAWLDRHSLGNHMRAIKATFGERAFIVHQDRLRFEPQDVFQEFAEFLGVEAFAKEAAFPRYNSRRGHRTDLCHNASVLRRFQRFFEPDYITMERVLVASGQPVPETLRRRETRCARAEELDERSARCNRLTAKCSY
eukprot:TRINITY_DN18085_c0_g1_i1.p1 TRINITY_DN18085_c0_g1~~TRINITY_DN18085_c0_g1_i1.p1  ORF type:complete len:522 (-),score=93.22 TRINITY_DN18085_c0_g1_i1:159-1724(-)